jgi:hypothetical protein
MNPHRQGDVFLQPVSTIPANATAAARDKGRVVLAYGEVTGHAHAILDREADIFAAPDTDERFLRVVGGLVAITPTKIVASILPAMWDVTDKSGTIYRLTATQVKPLKVGATSVLEGVTLRHEEHHAQVIAPGNYKLPHQREYVAPEIVRRVAD